MQSENETCGGLLFRYLGFINKAFSQQIENELQKQGYYDFQISNIWLLILIERFPDYTMNELAQVVNQSRANITIVSKKLVQKGYVVKNRPENNKKIIYLTLTEKWWQLKPIVFNLVNQLDQRIMQILSKPRYETLLADLGSIVELLKKEMTTSVK
ncbi:MarR family winged helix-turn-helix transcriptional regulator [Spiroplasma melliferum]|uniref:MarR family transcriptional regulator n=2 Tax=Spiroplasma melliferum TaxID=2134 RepID=A0AAI9T3W0_SPIME|nr:MarR family transcriptional regulator [Spiroplasma melliferum]ELL44565.1 MarR family transcriptional regulator [Spiroplasma melliferum IPMB4A]KAI93027.1 MarR family transcriptional regulator [Spiroplasma melliferum KC3]QCO24059.1 MarR family transcriptional regulator [Spiroplasma melliferum]